ncbi:hypothetical protein, partial [Neisseria sp.]|uniref:hypothetical protein n=1 Tax=Neisseria sp. TaxID=192066 RepID=UPI0028A1A3FF
MCAFRYFMEYCGFIYHRYRLTGQDAYYFPDAFNIDANPKKTTGGLRRHDAATARFTKFETFAKPTDVDAVQGVAA